MNIEFLPLAIFVMVATFTPGPGNITSAAMGMHYGYRATFKFLSGIVVGYTLVMALCASLSTTLLQLILRLNPFFVRVIGACSILWLALGVARASYNFSSDEKSPMLFKHGFLLQALNPKAIIFGLTLYTTFLSSINNAPFLLSASTFVLATVTLCSVSLWAFGGAKIGRYLHLAHVRKTFNAILVLLLIYCALTLSGLFTSV